MVLGYYCLLKSVLSFIVKVEWRKFGDVLIKIIDILRIEWYMFLGKVRGIEFILKVFLIVKYGDLNS